ncbi:MAG: ArsR/SmtB family transcription factor [Haloferacaceae archaeon]
MTDDAVTHVDDDTDGRQDVLQVLADPTSRAILQLLSEQMLTAAEVSDAMEVPLSTVYRKLDQLTETPLVESAYRFKSDGKHPRQYTCAFDRVRIRMSEENGGTIEVRIP